MAFKLGTNKSLTSRFSLKQLAVFTLAVVLVVTQIERLVNQGTLLGYQIRANESATSKTVQNNSGSLLGFKPSNQKSLACTKIDLKKVSDVMQVEMKQQPGFMPETQKPVTTSSCVFSANDPSASRMFTILMRIRDDEKSAKNILAALSKSSTVEKVNGVADEAIYNKTANQLTVRKEKTVYTLTVSARTAKNFDNKSAAVELAKNIRY